MRCGRCGRENPNGAGKCAYCGAIFRKRVVVAKQPQKKTVNKGILWAIAALFVVFLVVLGIFLFDEFGGSSTDWTGSGPSPTPAPVPVNTQNTDDSKNDADDSKTDTDDSKGDSDKKEPEQPAVDEATLKDKLLVTLKENTKEEVKTSFYEDFDGDGKKELFALAGKVAPSDGYSPDTFSGEIWYVDESKVKLVHQCTDGNEHGIGIVFKDSGEPQVIRQTDSVLAVINHVWGNGEMRTSVFCIKGNEPVMTECQGYLMTDAKGFLMEDSAYDLIIEKENFNKGEYIGTGRSYKAYWYYWDTDEAKLKEYGGVEITKEQFLTFDGAEQILASISGKTIHNILYRENGIININLLEETDLSGTNDAYTTSHITVEYDKEKKVSRVSTESEEDGIYLPALDVQNATFPTFK